MPLTPTLIQERRKFTRNGFPSRVAIHLLHPTRSIPANGVNVSERGLCLRLQESLEVRSLVRLQFLREGTSSLRFQRSMTCAGRVSWVVQRLDLRANPPFIFDAGIEFVDPPPSLRQLLVQQGLALMAQKRRRDHEKILTPAMVRGREYIPRLMRVSNLPLRWHLVVTVGGVPCFSEHYASARAAVGGWDRFKRQRTKL